MTIAEVSKTFGLTADTLRYYERIGLIPPVKRSSSGIRDYDEKDCNWVEFIKCMRDEYGAKGTASRDEFDAKSRAWYYAEVLKNARKAAGITQQQLADKIVAMQAVLERLDMKIDGYEERCLKFEEENLRQ